MPSALANDQNLLPKPQHRQRNQKYAIYIQILRCELQTHLKAPVYPAIKDRRSEMSSQHAYNINNSDDVCLFNNITWVPNNWLLQFIFKTPLDMFGCVYH